MITILTPTYNRSYTLIRLFESLEYQTDKDFEWIIVDDGSTDDTADLIEKLSINSTIPIHYYHQDNKGKPSAINTGMLYAEREYTLIVDSDDILINNAIESIKKSITDVNTYEKNHTGVCFRKAHFNEKIIGDIISSPEIYSFLTATEAGNLFKGDLAYCFKSTFLKKNKFPQFSKEKFVPELYIWNKITDEGRIFFHNTKIIYLCEYLPDGLSNNFKKQLKENPNGFLLFYKDQFHREKKLIEKIKKIIRVFQCYYYRAKK